MWFVVVGAVIGAPIALLMAYWLYAAIIFAKALAGE